MVTCVFARGQLQLPSFRATRKVLPTDKPYHLELKPGTEVGLSVAHTLLSRKKTQAILVKMQKTHKDSLLCWLCRIVKKPNVNFYNGIRVGSRSVGGFYRVSGSQVSAGRK